jgi:hypothetical protein
MKHETFNKHAFLFLLISFLAGAAFIAVLVHIQGKGLRTEAYYMRRMPRTDIGVPHNTGGIKPLPTQQAPLQPAVMSPKAGDRWMVGKAYDITWKRLGQGSKYAENVNITVSRYFGSGNVPDVVPPSTIIAERVPNNGKFSWTIPPLFPTILRNQQVIVTVTASESDSISAASGAFTVVTK